ncbi:hypothetical protein [Pantoea sp.]|uniref:hypothetical protein n=1 Tax=Pantoea sp. TaxID=69393 RepID=UPI0031DF6B7D
MAGELNQAVRGIFVTFEAGEIRKRLITTGRSMTAIIEGILWRELVHRAWRYVFERFNIRTEHVTEKAFHKAPGSKIVEEIRKKYNECAFLPQLFLK